MAVLKGSNFFIEIANMVENQEPSTLPNFTKSWKGDLRTITLG
jgi:hypothetical protein